MPKKLDEAKGTADLLEKLPVFQMYALGAPQDRITKAVGRQKASVNELLKGLPKGGRIDGDDSNRLLHAYSKAFR